MSLEIVYTDNYKIQKEQMDDKEVSKLEQAIEVHGYRGASKMKHNGVVNLKPEDTKLIEALNWYSRKFITPENYQHVIDVKIVAHCPSGNRAVGKLYRKLVKDSSDKEQYVLYVFGFSNYNYQLFKLV